MYTPLPYTTRFRVFDSSAGSACGSGGAETNSASAATAERNGFMEFPRIRNCRGASIGGSRTSEQPRHEPAHARGIGVVICTEHGAQQRLLDHDPDRKSTRLNSSH